MGKSSSKVDAIPSKHLKKGKREAKDDIEKPAVRAKKQKVEEKKVINVDDSPFLESKQPKVKASAKKVAVTNNKVDSISDSSSSDDDDSVTVTKKGHASFSKTAPVAQKKVESSDESDSDDDDDVVTVSKKVPSAKNNKSHIASTKKKVNSSSDDSSSSDETSSDDDIKAAAKKVPVAASQKKVSSNSSDSSSSSDDETSSDDNVTATKKLESSSDESSSDDDHDAVTVSKKVPSAINNKGHIASIKKKVDSSSDDSSSDETSSDDNVAAAKKVRVAASQKKVSSSSSDSSSDDETSSDDNATAAKKVPLASVAATQNKAESSSENSSSDDETNSDDNVAATKKIPPAMTNKSHLNATRKNAESSSDDTSSDDNVTAAKKVPAALPKKAMSADTSSDSDDETSSDDDVTMAKKVSATLPKKAESSSEDTESDSEDKTMQRSNAKLQIKAAAEDESSDESDDEPQKKRRKDTDVKVTAIEKIKTTAGKDGSPSENTNYTQPKTPTNPKGQTGSKTVFVGNLSYSVEKHDVENFFKVAGKVVDVRFGMNPDNTFKGFGHVEFASHEAAQKAVGELNKKELLGRPVRLDLAREKGAFTPPSSGRDTQSYQKRGREQWHQLYVRGFNKDVSEDEIRNSLLEHFGSCGDIAKINLPVDQEGGVKGFGYISFRDRDAFNKGLGLNGSNMRGNALYLEEARPREGRDSAPSDKKGDQDSAGRNRVDHRVTPNRGRVNPSRERAIPNKGRVTYPSRPSIATVATGKKTTFDDNDD